MRRDPAPAERKLWYEFLRTLPQKFSRQKPLGPYIADFYCSQHKLVIELDGDSHYADGAKRYDETRTFALERLGARVMRFTNQQVMQDFGSVCAEIIQTLENH